MVAQSVKVAREWRLRMTNRPRSRKPAVGPIQIATKRTVDGGMRGVRLLLTLRLD